MVQRCIRTFGLLGTLTVAALITPAEAAFTTPIVVTDEDVAEPAIDIAKDGTIYINAPVGLLSNLPGSPSLLLRSQDDGASWQRLDPGILRGSLPGGGDSEVVLDPNDGTVYYTDLYLVDSTISVSRDTGNTWTFSNPVGGVPVHDRQWLATSGGGVVYHTYNQAPTGLWVTKSIDGGLTWVLGSIAATAVDRTGCLCPPGTIVAEDGGPSPLGLDDRVGVIYSTSTGGMRFARSTNGGATFTAAQDIDSEGVFGQVDVALLEDGAAVVSWWRRAPTGGTALVLRTITPDGAPGELRTIATNATPQPLDVPQMLRTDDALVLTWTDAASERVSSARVTGLR